MFSGDLESALGIESRGFPSLFFVKTDYILKVEIFVLNGGNIFFLTTKVGWWEGGKLLDTDLLNVMRLRSEITDALEVERVVS